MPWTGRPWLFGIRMLFGYEKGIITAFHRLLAFLEQVTAQSSTSVVITATERLSNYYETAFIVTAFQDTEAKLSRKARYCDSFSGYGGKAVKRSLLLRQLFKISKSSCQETVVIVTAFQDMEVKLSRKPR